MHFWQNPYLLGSLESGAQTPLMAKDCIIDKTAQRSINIYLFYCLSASLSCTLTPLTSISLSILPTLHFSKIAHALDFLS